MIESWKSSSAAFDTWKFRVRFGDGHAAEIVRIVRPEKVIYCVSCMVGCPVACPFCVSGLRYGRRLKAEEMMELLDAAWRTTIVPDKPSLVSMMGSGEPLLNAVEVHRFMEMSRCDRYALSTSGVGIQTLPLFADIPGLKVQISVHTVDDELRQQMIPGTPPLDEIVSHLKAWPRRRVEWNFVFWKGLNDSEAASSQIAIWARRHNIRFIKVNAARGNLLPPSERTHQIINELRAFGLRVEFYETDGEDIQAGCGQLM